MSIIARVYCDEGPPPPVCRRIAFTGCAQVLLCFVRESEHVLISSLIRKDIGRWEKQDKIYAIFVHTVW